MKNLKQHRIENMLTVRGLAAAARVSPSTLTDISSGRVTPHLSTMSAIACALGLEDVRDVAEFDHALASRISEAA